MLEFKQGQIDVVNGIYLYLSSLFGENCLCVLNCVNCETYSEDKLFVL